LASSSTEVKNLFEIKRYEGESFELCKERMLGILFLRDCAGTLVEKKSDSMDDDAWNTLNDHYIYLNGRYR
jgi:hypothetical protein